MERLTKEEVEHVMDLARIYLTSEEIDKYAITLKQLLNEVEKINDITGYDDDLMFTPVNKTKYIREDSDVCEMLTKEEVLKNAPAKNGSFMEVPVMISE